MDAELSGWERTILTVIPGRDTPNILTLNRNVIPAAARGSKDTIALSSSYGRIHIDSIKSSVKWLRAVSDSLRIIVTSDRTHDSARTGILTVYSSKYVNLPITITVTQPGPKNIVLSPDTLKADFAAGQTSVTLNSNDASQPGIDSLKTTAGWLHAVKTGVNIFNVSFEKNTDSLRIGHVVVYSSQYDNSPDTLIVKQMPPLITVKPVVLYIPDKSGSTTIRVTRRNPAVTWTAAASAGWITGVNKTNDSTLAVNYSENYSGTRKDSIIITCNSTEKKKIPVIQASKWKIVSSEYDNLNNVMKVSVDDQYFTWYSYDAEGRLSSIKSYTADSLDKAKNNISYTYYGDDKISGYSLYNKYGNLSENVTNTYDPARGWLKIIRNNINNNFSEDLNYHLNGNILNQTIKNSAFGWSDQTFVYEYDNMNRLEKMKNSSEAVIESYSYDPDGNLETKMRAGENLSFTLTSGKNTLDSVKINGIRYAMTYDSRGNLIYDGTKGITIGSYDRRNLPLTMTAPSGTYTFNYDDQGNRVVKTTSTVTLEKEMYLRDNSGSERAIYDMLTGRIKSVNLFASDMIGRVDFDDEGYHTFYYIKDHLGTTRVTLSDSGSAVNAYDYYPFGETDPTRSSVNQTDTRYKFTGKERDAGTSYDYFGARFYDSRIGRWLSVDPLADKYPGWSPYNYTLGNPLKYYDPNGLEVHIVTSKDELTKLYGETYTVPTETPITFYPPYKFKTTYNNIDYVKNQLEGFAAPNAEWMAKGKHYAPKIANYLNSHTVNVAVDFGLNEWGVEANTNINTRGIVLGMHLFTNGKGTLDKTFLHEMVHHIYGGNEVRAYAAVYAAGYGTFNNFMEMKYHWKKYLTAKQLNKYFDANDEFKEEKLSEFEAEIREIGEGTIGR